MPKAFLFPGQGSQYVGMGSDFYYESIIGREKYICANDILGYDLAQMSFTGPENKLRKTNFTQPAIFVHSIIIDEYLKNIGIFPDAVAGHSLGEFSALVSAGVLTFKDALKIVNIRALAMMQAGKTKQGTMAAIIGANSMQIDEICNQNSIVVPANINAPGQIVISGEIDAIKLAIKTAKNLGVKRAIQLNVSGAFHSPLMKSARKSLKEIIDNVYFKDAKIPIYQNVIGTPVTESDKIKKNIIKQLENPVLWSQTITNMVKNGINEFFELGPGKILTGLNKRINNTITNYNIDKMEHINVFELL